MVIVEWNRVVHVKATKPTRSEASKARTTNKKPARIDLAPKTMHFYSKAIPSSANR